MLKQRPEHNDSARSEDVLNVNSDKCLLTTSRLQRIQHPFINSWRHNSKNWTWKLRGKPFNLQSKVLGFASRFSLNCNNCLNKRNRSLLKQQCLPTIDCQQWRRQQIDPLPPLRPPICQSPHKSGRSGAPSVSRKTPVMRLDWKQVSCRRTSLSSGS